MMTHKQLQYLDKIFSENTYYKRNGYSHYVSWEQIPILTKQMAQDNFDSIFTNSADIIYTQTSGSSGHSLIVPWNRYDYIYSISALWRKRESVGIKPFDRFCSCHLNLIKEDRYIESKQILNGQCLSFSKKYADSKNMRIYLEAMNRFNPAWLQMQPSFLYGLLMESINSSIPFPNSIKYVELVGEFITKEQYTFFIKHFKCIKILYGMQEFNGLAYGDFDKLEILQSNAHIDIVPVKEGDLDGKIVVTGFTNRAFPLVRYDSGDLGYIKNVDGKKYLVITQSKCNDSLEINGTHYDGSIFFNIVTKLNFLYGDFIKQFQFYKSNDILRANFVVAKNINKTDICNTINELFSEAYGYRFSEIFIEYVASINVHKDKSKVKYFINEDI